MPLMTKMNNEARKELAMMNTPVRQSAIKAVFLSLRQD